MSDNENEVDVTDPPNPRPHCLRLPYIDDGEMDATKDHRCLHTAPFPIPISAHPLFLRRVNDGFIRLADKWYMMMLGFSCLLREFDGKTATFKVRMTPRCKLTEHEIVEKMWEPWKEHVEGLAECEQYEMHFYHLPQGFLGGMIDPAAHANKREFQAALKSLADGMKQAAEETKIVTEPYAVIYGSFLQREQITVVYHPQFGQQEDI